MPDKYTLHEDPDTNQGHPIVSFILDDDYKHVTIVECCDFYYEAIVDKDGLKQIIDDLLNFYERMIKIEDLK